MEQMEIARRRKVETLMKLFVYGCSFSDRFGGVNHCYGDILSKKLNVEYSHHGVAKCGSNDRIYRQLTNDVLEGDVTSDDLVLIQYTTPMRKEFATWVNPRPTSNVRETMNDYHLVRYKDGCHQWHHHEVIKDFLKIYEEYMSITHFDYVNFKLENIRLQTFLAHYDINACILGLTCYAPMQQDMDISIPYFKNRIYWNKEIGDAKDERYAPDDPFHLSENGHCVLAQSLYTWLNEKGHVNG